MDWMAPSSLLPSPTGTTLFPPHPLISFLFIRSRMYITFQALGFVASLYSCLDTVSAVAPTAEELNVGLRQEEPVAFLTVVTQINHAIGAEGFVSMECKEVVKRYGELILELLIGETRPSKVCSQIGLCIFDGARYVGTGIDSVVDKQEEEGSSLNQDLLCTACEMAVVWIESQLRENKTKEQILAYANELCERLPSPIKESTVSCDQIASMPDISFTIAEKNF